MTTRHKRVGRQTAESAEHTKAAIMQAAVTLFARNGFEGTSLRDISSNAGLSHGIIRHHFGSKMEIWLAVAKSVFALYAKEILPVIADASQSDDGFKSFVKVVRSFVRISMEKPELVSMMVREGGFDTPRSQYINEHFDWMHQQISILFDKAKSESAALKHHTNESFFLFLMSLVVFPVVVPAVARSIPMANFKDENQNALREHLILSTLLGH